jgi:hypoxanthine phosphoribosyltransferase
MTSTTDDKLEVLTWEIFGAASRQLAINVAASGYHPDLILAIARGGLPIGGALGYALGVKNCATINVEFYTGVGERMEVRWCYLRHRRWSIWQASRSSWPTMSRIQVSRWP